MGSKNPNTLTVCRAYSILCFSSWFFSNQNKTNLEKVFSWLILIKECFKKCKYKIFSCYEPLFNLLLDEDKLSKDSGLLILVNEHSFKTFHGKWCSVKLKWKCSYSERHHLIKSSKLVPKNVLVIKDCTLVNFKKSLNASRYSCLSDVRMCLYELEDYSPPEAYKVVVSFFQDNVTLPLGSLTGVFSNYLKTPRHFCIGDIYSICIHHYSSEIPEKGIVLFSVNDAEADGAKNCKMYTVTENTSIFDETPTSNFVPMKHWELFDEKNIRSVSPVLPLGFEKYYSKIIGWFRPFLLHNLIGLAPVFILHGPSGVGKSIVLEAVCSSLGIYYIKFDCYNIVSNTTTQIKANIKSIFKSAQKQAPLVLQLSNAEVLCSDAGGNDPLQMIDILTESIFEIKQETVIVVFTCHSINSLNSNLMKLPLEILEMEAPNEKERHLMLSWLSHRAVISLTDNALKLAAQESQTYVFADLEKMIHMSLKAKMLKEQKDCWSVQPLEDEDLKKYIDGAKDKGDVGNVEWEDVGGVELLKKEVLDSLLSSKLIKGLERRGLLLHGPPGTGKTLLARVVANQCNRTFIPVKGPELLNMYVGQSEANIREVFKKARDNAPSILFFDELDSLAPNRGNKSDSGGVMDRVVSQLLAEMDGLDTTADVFILAATNRPDLIDPALLRPGRFDKLLYVGPCEDNDSKLKVLQAITRRFRFHDDFALSSLLTLLPEQVAGANLYALCSEAWMEAAKEIILDPEKPKNSKVFVGKHHFIEALKTVKL